ncbi:liver merozoite formation protein [Plasmodium gonderi]|uniref:Liver merozoite formation protein n=1 Tax=Plasmodium gonderi TaxID=77519 RepID=A0A1Y1JLA6_PLAGO|nr:liver merozoite formation protein [Plasmodium gonderi]GAW81997.1 liver merozoite formation protein [Plasmodium gonderi]
MWKIIPCCFFIAWCSIFLRVSRCKKILFLDLLNGGNIMFKKKVHINKRPLNNREYFSNHPLHVNRNAEQTITKNDETSYTTNDDRDENILQHYIYTLSHLTIFDIDREKNIPLNIALLLKACLASHNYIKNVEIFTSDVQNKEVCSFIYENRKNFETFFNLHIMKYVEFFETPKIMETLKSYIDDKKVYEKELEIFRRINTNTKLRKDILQDILFECTRLNKIIQYSLAINKLDLFSYPVMFKLFAYFKNNDIYYYIFINNINKIKYYYETKNIKEEDKKNIYKIVDSYLYIFDRMNATYQGSDVS